MHLSIYRRDYMQYQKPLGNSTAEKLLTSDICKDGQAIMNENLNMKREDTREISIYHYVL